MSPSVTTVDWPLISPDLGVSLWQRRTFEEDVSIWELTKDFGASLRPVVLHEIPATTDPFERRKIWATIACTRV